MKKLLSILIMVLLQPVGIWRLLNQSLLGVIQLPLLYIMITLMKSNSMKVAWIGLGLMVIIICLFLIDVCSVLKKETTKKNWNIFYKALFLVFGLIITVCLTIVLRYVFAFTYLDNQLILPFEDGIDISSNQKKQPL